MHYAISYVSTASNSLKFEEIPALLKKSEERNNTRNITGLLLFSEGNFFQVIEGEKEKIKELYMNICEDKRHSNIIKLFETDIEKEAYDGYKSDLVPESAGYDMSKFQTYSHYLEILETKKQNAVKNLLKAFIR